MLYALGVSLNATKGMKSLTLVKQVRVAANDGADDMLTSVAVNRLQPTAVALNRFP